MKTRFWLVCVGVCLSLVGAGAADAASYYLNDAYVPGTDVYTTAAGNDANAGTTPGAPKATLGNLIATASLTAGDVVYIDTGTYAPATISNTVVGASGNRILFQGSTNPSGTVFTGSGVLLTVSGQHVAMADIRLLGGSEGLRLSGAHYCDFQNIVAVSNSVSGITMPALSNSNAFRRCTTAGSPNAVRITVGAIQGNTFENSVLLASGVSLYLNTLNVSNMVGCVIGGGSIFIQNTYIPAQGSRNIFYGLTNMASDMEAMAELQRSRSGWRGNTVADPRFANAAGLDFRLLSPAGYLSNGVWVTNAALAYSPGIDFGRRGDTAYTNEPAPNGGRVNIGLFGGMAEASKSRTNDWFMALSFNDGGNLIQTGHLEWVGGNLGPGTTVDLQYSTNNGSSWSNIATGVAATNEIYDWVPAASHPSVLWRVMNSTNAAACATNAKPFSIRTTTNTVFSFYVNDSSTNRDLYCTAVGDNANSGIFSNAPKRSLQAILDAYDLEGGDTVWVDTGDYATNQTVVISRFESGWAGGPVRIIGSPNGSIFNRGNSSVNTLELLSAGYMEIENLNLSGGNYGLFGNLSSNILFRNLRVTDNQTGVYLTGTQHAFENCLLANNSVVALRCNTALSNLWTHGVMWGSPSLVIAQTNALAVSNSILGSATALFGAGSQVVPGDYNVVWQAGVGLTYSTFSALQNAGYWTRSLYADPQFAHAAGGDYHLKSLMGRYDTNTSTFVTNDVVHSPAIDWGDPLSPAYINEPAPNGSRVNAGVHGGTAQASKSRTNTWLQVISYPNGGTLDAAAGSWLRWDGGNYPGGATVTVWLSRDDGASWEPLATGLNATNGAYFYQNTSTNDSSALYARWMVSLDGAVPEVASQTATNFNYRNGAYSFYVNDASTNGDVYCTAVGNATNLGVSAGSPKASLAALVAAYPVAPGDRIYVDTGIYHFPETPVVLTAQHSGTATNKVTIIGSTNRLAGGSVFGQAGAIPTALGFDFRPNSSNIVMRDIVLTNMAIGVLISNASSIRLEHVEVRGGTSRAFDLQANARNIELLRCVAHGGATGVYLKQSTNITIRNCVLWQNSAHAVFVDSQVGATVENSALASTNANAVLYSYAVTNGFSTDYNGIHAGPNTRVGLNRTSGVYADNLAAWQVLASGRDQHSMPGDPQFANASQYDYHLRTERTLGRLQTNGTWTSDSSSSPLLDAGNPATAVADEPMPNGGRVNIGCFGGTWEASMAVDSPWLKTMSLGDAGGVQDGAVALRWLAGGGFSNETVQVDVSVDGGKTWGVSVTSGVPATNGLATWMLSGLPDTPAAIWRVVCLERPTVTAQTTNFFSIRNNPLNLYVATADTNGTIYTTGPGAANNWTAASNAPLNSLRTAFDRFDLEAGDQIWVDTGVYSESNSIWVGPKNSGTSNNPVRVAGNTQAPYSGTVLARTSRSTGSYGIQIAYAGGVQFSNLMVSNAFIGIHEENSQLVLLDRVRVGSCVTSAVYVGASSRMALSASIVEQSLFAGLNAFTGSTVQVTGSLLRDNAKAAIYLQGGQVSLRNSILEASGSQRYTYYWGGGGSLSSDYNNIRVSSGASVAGGDSRQPDRFLIDWQISTAFSNDVSSVGYEAYFNNAANLDFHLKSAHGRFDPGIQTYVATDSVTSLLIDLGDPASAYTNEPAPNGGRINMGLYGNTDEASMSSGLGSLVPLTMSDGGTIRGEAELYWSWNGLAANDRVYVEFSPDGGVTWTNIATNVYADVGSSGLAWVTTNFPSTAQGAWRVCTTNGETCGQTIIPFAVKNDPLSYYINDGSTNGDVYCSAVGSSANSGLSADSPLHSLETLLGRYKVEHGDTVYVDTGIYPRSSPLVLSIPGLAPTNYLVIQGSTNEAAGGTVFTNSSGAVIDLQNSRRVELRDLRLQGGDPGLLLTESSSNRLFRVRSTGARNAFFLSSQSDRNQFIQCAALSFSSTGFHVVRPTSFLIPPTTNFWSGGVISSIAAGSNGYAVSTGALLGGDSGKIYVSNSVFVANGPAHAIYSVVPGVLYGDYNAYHQPHTNSLFAKGYDSSVLFGVSETELGNLGSWIAWNHSDSNSLSADPLFADLAGGDLHPRSAGGRYSPTNDSFVIDTESSPLIDTGDPAAPWSLETSPNGGRLNIGIYGNDPHASRTPPLGTYVLLSLNQGGVASGTNTLRWLARGAATNAGNEVYIQISTNSGADWRTIRTNPAVPGTFAWDSTAHATTPTARWRVQSRSSNTWLTTSEMDFMIHNSNITYYVNDAATSNDAYCSEPGSASNTGLSPASPLSSIAKVLERYDLEPGDEIRVDTGIYGAAAPFTMGYLDGGTTAQPVRILGSTNHPGTELSGAGMKFDGVRGVVLDRVRFNSQTAADTVISIDSSEDIALTEMDLWGGVQHGVIVSSSSNTTLRNFSVAGVASNGVTSMASYNTCLDYGVLWSNGTSQASSRNQLSGGAQVPAREASFMTVSNCILGAYGIRIPIYEIRGNLLANFNNLYRLNGALAALSYESGFAREYDSVGNWTRESGQDSMSLSHNPNFADPIAGDFHLKSSTGRYVRATGEFVVDAPADNSTMIDAGDPAILCTEPIPNGGLVNIGRHANTAEASKTPTNSALAWITFNDGGRASGTNVSLRWLARGAVTSLTVSIYYSSDGGATWTNSLVSGIPASDLNWVWDSTLSAQSVRARLKIVATDGTEAIAGLFSVRNDPFVFYLNDGSTANDVYCSAIGNDANSGLETNAPMADLNALLARYDLEGGDIVYIDTGVYRGLDPWRITQADSAGELGVDPVVFQGSTHSLVNGTVLDRSFSSIGIQADYAVGIRVRNITVSNTVGDAVLFNDCYDAAAEWVVVGSGNVGFRLSAGSQLGLANCLAYSVNQGVIVEDWNLATNTVFPVIEHCVFWETEGSAIQLGGNNKATVRHCILSTFPGEYVYAISPTDELTADYNSIWLGSGGRVCRQEEFPLPTVYETVGAWATASGQDLHSYDGDPLLANASGRDFHLRSTQGRWVDSSQSWATDMVSSPLIDAGDPSAAGWTNEPAPNGGRKNIGLYGGTAVASKSSTNSALHLLSLNNGGVAYGQVALNWKASGLATGHTVRIEVSIDNGSNWTVVAEGVDARLGGLTWNSLSLPSSPLALWRVQDEQDAGVAATSALNFVLHNGPVTYYVNDEFTDGDMYCSGIGDSDNTGATADSPKRWVAEIMDTYNLEPGDIIYVDTGIYQTPDTTVIGDLDAGQNIQESSEQVTLLGSTNVVAGGSVYILSDPDADGFALNNTAGIRLENLSIVGARAGLALSSSYAVYGQNLEIRDCENGARVQMSSNILFSHSAFHGNENAGIEITSESYGNVKVDSSVLWSNHIAVLVYRGYADVTNSILGMVAPQSFGFYQHVDTIPNGVRSDYNNLYVSQADAAVGAYHTGGETPNARTNVFKTVSAWSQFTGQDNNSLEQDPVLADPSAGDFHLKSTGGRFQYGTGWVQDTVSSPLINAGNPQTMTWTYEPDPNGRRVNIGMHGGTEQASKTPTNGLLLPKFPNTGARVSGVVTMQWAAVGAATNLSVLIEYSPDDGVAIWTNIVDGALAGDEVYLWDSTTYGRSSRARWRITAREDTSITGMSGRFILDGEGSIPYYVNDNSTNGDVYCTAVGNDENDGLTPATPKASLQDIIDENELAKDDVVYVDAGNYTAGAPPILITQTDAGQSNMYVVVQGSTNPAAPTVFSASSFSAPYVFSLEYAVNVRLRNLTIRNASAGVRSFHTIGCELNDVRIENNRNIGLKSDESAGLRVIRSILWKNSSATGGVALAMSTSEIQIENSVLWGSPVAVSVDSGTLTVTNSVLDASGVAGRIYLFSAVSDIASDFQGDYNCYRPKNGALIAEQQLRVGGSLFYSDMPAWIAAFALDRHSMAQDPRFSNEITGDFHPQSTQGRYANGTWLVDSANSPLIDAGSLDWPSGNELAPNGGIINLGAYGNTPQASLTPTNPPWLRTIAYNEGGVVTGNILLFWLYGGMASNELVKLEFSSDYEVTWQPIASNIPAGTREYEWDISSMPLSLALNWRVTAQSNTNVWDISDFPISIKPGCYDYYVNDGSTNGDVWCTAPGTAWDPYVSYGTNPATPIDSLAALLEHYPVGACDRIYVDTGVYPVSDTASIVLDADNIGTVEAPLKIFGSTNVLAGGALLQGNGTANGINIRNTRNIEIYDLRISGARNGVALLNVSDVILDGLESFGNSSNGVWVSGSGGVQIRHARLWNNNLYGYFSTGSKGGEMVNHSTLWANRSAAVSFDEGLSVSNSILGVTNAVPVYIEAARGKMSGDFNLYGVGASGIVGTNSLEKTAYVNLSQWQGGYRDLHSVVASPLFVDSTNGNFHLQSRAGYWSNGTWAISANTSWAIDAGDPDSTAHTNEPAPNGGRLNLGAYGGTAEASKSDAAVAELFPTSLRDGGVAPDGQPLYWLFRGIDPTNTVRIEFSLDGGASWSNVASAIRVDSPPYYWFGACMPSPEALWRLVLESNTNIVGATSNVFTYRPCPLVYYVNDGSTNGDVYCTAIGAFTNKGYFASSPLDSIQTVLDRYQLAGGDVVKVDTGVYVVSNSQFIGVLDSGDTTNRVTFTGSTNRAAGGSWLQPAAGFEDPAILFHTAHDVTFAGFRMTGFSNGVSFAENSARCTLADLDIQGSEGPGVMQEKSTEIQLNRVLIREGDTNGLSVTQSDSLLDGCVIWSNLGSAVFLGSGAEIGITNSVLTASGVGRYCYESSTNPIILSDYNNLFITNGAQIANLNGEQSEKVPAWIRESSQDRHSLSTDPRFQDPAAGDFHVRSVAGRYVVASSNFVPDAVDTNLPNYSALIDLGPPQAAWSNELSPNGQHRNIGLHGNTPEASKSNTNRWLLCVTAQNGGILYGQINLVWGYGRAIASNEIVRLEYSYDDGLNWVRIGESAVGAREYSWQSDLKQAGIELYPSSPAAKWRIYLQSDTNIWAISDRFGLRNSPFKYYINDTSTVNDVYTTAIGNDANLGFFPWVPKLNLTALLEEVDLEPTDEVYIDTGTYRMNEPNPPWMSDTNTPIVWQSSDGGNAGQPVLVRGSWHADGSTFKATNRFFAGGIFFMDANYVDLRNLRFSGESLFFEGAGLVVSNWAVTNGPIAGVALSIETDDASFIDLQVDRCSVELSGQGNRIERMRQRWGASEIVGTNVTLLNSVVYVTNALQTGVVVNASSAVISNSTIVSSRGTAVGKRGFGTLRMGHNILVAGGEDSSSVIHWGDGGLISDWNNLLARDSAWVGTRNGKWERLAYWQAASGQDANSVSFDPLFQNETQGDFHLNSIVGRWSQTFNTWDVDGTHSPVIDLGDPWLGTALEPMPNGYLRNLGAYGGTLQASKSSTNLWLTALTQNDGGVLKGTNVVLRWAAGNAGGKTVTLQYFDGTTWTNIATGVSATDGSYVWNTMGFPDSFAARWRVVAEDGSGVSDQTDHDFNLRNYAHAFYVNDADTTDDLYCAAIGSAGNDGLTDLTPRLSLQSIFDTYDLEGGDVVYLDTGTYPSSTDIRIIWSRSGSTNADVVIQGNTNGAHSLLTRTGSTNYPAVALDVKASEIQINDVAIRGVDRGILLDTNRNATIQGVVVSEAGTGLSADGAVGVEVRNSAFWKTHVGVSLFNTRTSVLENLTFAGSTLAGIQLNNTLVDTLQNNIFIPAANAYAYSIGTATSLLANATMDYNLYDFSNAGAWFYDGATNDLRRWQLAYMRDFRSALTNADLADIEFTGDFHPRSEYGRWTAGGWVQDETTSWAIDHGHPDQDYSLEPTNHGERLNIGMYGNTVQASQGSTNIFFDCRTLNESGIIITQEDPVWPLIWSAHLIDGFEWVLVQFSGDDGETWITLTNTSAYTEYFVWRASAEYQTALGRWRVIGTTPPEYSATNANPFRVRFFNFAITTSPRPVNGLMRFNWIGGVQGLRYHVEYSDDFGQTWQIWEEKYNGPAPINRSNFVIPPGGSQTSYTFEDRTSYSKRTRWYRMKEITE